MKISDIKLMIRSTDFKIRRQMDAAVAALPDGEKMRGTFGFVLKCLAESEATTLKDLERRCGSARTTIGECLNDMQSHGWVERETTDKGVVSVKLTEGGRSMHEKMEAISEQYDQTLIEGITAEDLEIFYQVLTRMNANMKANEQK